jgi:anion-transporting  ArsA/GET3 family ATPase
VVDAPPTGRVVRFLNVTAEAARLTKVGPIKNQSEGVAAVLRSPMTLVHVVTLLEEMPVQETSDAVAELARHGLPVGRIIVNATLPPVLSDIRITPTALQHGLAIAGLSAERDTVAGLLMEADAYQTRTGVEAAMRTELESLGHPIIELPALVNGVTREGLGVLAAHLRAG